MLWKFAPQLRAKILQLYSSPSRYFAWLRCPSRSFTDGFVRNRGMEHATVAADAFSWGFQVKPKDLAQWKTFMDTVTSPEPLNHVSAILLHNWMTNIKTEISSRRNFDPHSVYHLSLVRHKSAMSQRSLHQWFIWDLFRRKRVPIAWAVTWWRLQEWPTIFHHCHVSPWHNLRDSIIVDQSLSWCQTAVKVRHGLFCGLGGSQSHKKSVLDFTILHSCKFSTVFLTAVAISKSESGIATTLLGPFTLSLIVLLGFTWNVLE